MYIFKEYSRKGNDDLDCDLKLFHDYNQAKVYFEERVEEFKDVFDDCDYIEYNNYFKYQDWSIEFIQVYEIVELFLD